MTTYGEIVNHLARQGQINRDDAKTVADYYWETNIIQRCSTGFTIRNSAYTECSTSQRVLEDARQEVV